MASTYDEPKAAGHGSAALDIVAGRAANCSQDTPVSMSSHRRTCQLYQVACILLPAYYRFCYVTKYNIYLDA
jgi:hypothetical protein